MTRGQAARDLAESLGAAWVGDAQEAPPEPLDAAILFAPVGTLVPVALEALDRGGTLAIAGIHLTDIPSLSYERHLFFERDLRSVTANTRADGMNFLSLATQMPLRVATVIHPFEDAQIALQDLAAGRVTGAAVIRVAES
jgi:propanol-preferring alcohol dehydrogenase